MPEMQQRSSIASATTSPFVSATSPQLTSLLPDEDGDPHVPDSIPPWVHLTPDYEPPEPEPARPNTRHWKPPPPHNFRPGKKWDHLRNAEAALISSPIREYQLAWKPFMQSGPDTTTEANHEGARLMSDEWIRENMPISARQWEESDERNVDKDADLDGFWLLWFLTPERRERTIRVFWRLMLKNPFVPLVFRIVVLAFAATALGIAATIFENVNQVNSDPDPDNNCSQRASTYMAVIVGAVALPYILFITWDEYTAKPLGLRSAFAKTSLILLDLIFIIMASSNLSLAFEALFDHRWACYSDSYQDIPIPTQDFIGTCSNNAGLCYKQKALTAVLFLSLVSWLITFSISVMRVVEKLRV